MPPLADIDEFRALLGDVSTLGQRDLTAAWRKAEGMDKAAARQYFMAATPDIVEQYATVSGLASAEFYDAQLPGSAFRAIPADPPPVAQVEASTSWALSSLDKEGAASPLNRFSGSLQRMVFQTSRKTILGNVSHESGATWARTASLGACAFCRMLATRGDTYASKESALVATKREDYHDNCRCLAICVRPGDTYELPAYVEQWDQEYKDAVAATPKVGKSNAIDLKAVLAHMGPSKN